MKKVFIWCRNNSNSKTAAAAAELRNPRGRGLPQPAAAPPRDAGGAQEDLVDPTWTARIKYRYHGSTESDGEQPCTIQKRFRHCWFREPGGSDVSGPSGRSGSDVSPWGFSPRLASHVASRKESVGPHEERTDEQTRRHLLQVTERRKPRISGSAPQPRAAKEPPAASVDSKQLAEQTFGGSNLQMCFRGRLERLRVCVSACLRRSCRGKPV